MLLHVRQLTKDYGAFRALDRLDLDVAPGEIFGLLGPNGSGKSTALRLMLGFLRPTLGTASIAGHDCWYDSVHARRHVGYLPGDLRLYENMTGRQLVRFLGKLRGELDGERIDHLAQVFDIDVSRPIANLSSGMKRKVALLQVLLPRTPLLILDEPTNTLDPTMRDELMGQLVEARQRGQAVLFSSHVLAEVERVCDRVAILQRGRLAHVQKMAELRQVRMIRARFPQPVTAMPNLPGLQAALPSPLGGEGFQPGLPSPSGRGVGGEGLPVLPSPSGRGVGGEGMGVRGATEWSCEYGGPLPELLVWLASNGLQDLKIEPLGLAGIYRQYHGGEA